MEGFFSILPRGNPARKRVEKRGQEREQGRELHRDSLF